MNRCQILAIPLGQDIAFIEAEADSLYTIIKEAEFSDVYEVNKAASALQNLSNNRKAQAIGTYYSKVASFYISGNENLLYDIDDLYAEFTGDEYEYIRLEIDLLLIDYFFGKSDLERASKILELSLIHI